MNWYRTLRSVLLGSALSALLAACQTPRPVDGEVVVPDSQASHVRFELPEAWGGEVRCGAQGCFLGAIEHENNKVVVYRLQGRTVRLLDRQPVAYHPDSAVWLSDNLLGAAVEEGGAIDIFRLEGERLMRVHKIHVGFSPRDVILLQAQEGHFRLLATPYEGTEVAWLDWYEDNRAAAQVQRTVLCRTPWHPTRVSRVPNAQGGGIAVACLDDKSVIYVPGMDATAQAVVLARFSSIPRQVRPSPTGRWLYIALETGGRNARVHMETGELQWISAPPTGFVSVAALSDDLVLWGDSQQIFLQRLGAAGNVLEARKLVSSGFSTSLQLLDLDKDGHQDLVVLNSAGKEADVFYGPLWELAQPVMP
ncbi:VCBS repeat-containing protein [Acidovorax sp. 210-6]|uniref:FG-GAP repeat domain-containing protein n=1 Tax=Acidovorax sp. 210-6 TaxID=2699468 RepID=UPI0013899062|nr:VCBS repeat-containing protein [Acidovorax sp. 210-6]